MKIIQDLLNILPNILLYLVTGYLYISIFHFVALKESKEEMNHVLTSSLVIGYIIVNIVNMIPFSISYSVDSIGIAFAGAVSGFVFGKIYHGRLFDRIVQLFHIRSTPNKYIWTDLMDMDYPIYPMCRKTPCFSYGDIRHSIKFTQVIEDGTKHSCIRY